MHSNDFLFRNININIYTPYLNITILIPRSKGLCLIWDVNVSNTLTSSYLHSTFVFSGSAADGAASGKISKYTTIA